MHPRYKKKLIELCLQKNMDIDLILGKSQGRLIAYHRRHLILDMSKEFPGLSTTQLGLVFSRDHSTISQARKIALEESTNGATSKWLLTALGTGRSVNSSPAKLIPFAGQ